MADRRKLAQGLMMMTPSARADIAQQADEFERFKQADYLRKMGEQGAGLAKSVARGVPQMATGLVDLASMPFEAAGVLEPGQAVGSTKWLENRGYLPESQPGFANQLTELLSGGFDPSDLITKGAPMLAALRTTWHGSPHGFTKFDMSKIGTGEGAQAYGHGLYLAESPDVAGSYRTAGDMGWYEREADKALYSQDIDNAIASTKKELERVSKEPRYVDAKNNLTGVLNVLEARKAGANEYGYLYKVDLPDEQIAKMLDWDKPLSEQNEYVKNALKNVGVNVEKPAPSMKIENLGQNEFGVRLSSGHLLPKTFNSAQEASSFMAGNELLARKELPAFAWLETLNKTNPEKSAYLNELGIPGIQYLDQASRGAGEGTRNYVVFSDEIPQILERNGQPIAQALREYKQQFPEGMLGKTGMFETGTPVSFEYIRNTEKSPYMGEKFGQDIEPAGRYLSYKDPVVNMESMPNTWETGQVSFNNPLVVNFGEGYGTPTNWKKMVSESFGGKTGKDLSKAVANAGYDGIVTVDKYGTSEIVDLSNFLSKEK